MKCYWLYGVGSFQNPPALRGFVALQMMVSDQLMVIFPVSLN